MKIRRFFAIGGSLVLMAALSACTSADNSTEITSVSEETDVTETSENNETSASDETSETPEEAEKLVFSRDSGLYEEAFELEITPVQGGEIYYTLDGSNPADSSTAVKYEGSISIAGREGDVNVVSAVDPLLFCTNFSSINKKTNEITCEMSAPADSAVVKCTVLKAVEKYADGTFGEVSTVTYFIGTAEEHIQGIKESCEAAGTDLAVISISMDYDDLFDSTTGIYVKGDVFEAALPSYIEGGYDGELRKLEANYNQRGREWEREAHVDFFEMNGEGSELVLNQDCGIRIQGNYSRSDLQKSFRLYAREDYGKGKFKYAIWGDSATDIEGEVIDSFDTFVLRAGGNCTFNAKFNDTYWQQLLKDLDCDTKAARPCVVYLNGEYWGLYILEEDYTDNYYEDHYGVDKDTVVSYKGDAEALDIGYKLDTGELPEGETNVKYYFTELLDFFKNHTDLKSEEDYAEFTSLVDEESVRDYFAAQIWMNNKWDWPGKNWLMWKTTTADGETEYGDGRWRLAFFDLDFGGVSGSGEATTNTIKEDNYKTNGLIDMDTKNPVVLCFAYLMTNDGFREDFCNKLTSLSDNELSKEKANALMDVYEGTYGPLYDQFFARYEGTGSKEDALTGGYASASCIRSFIYARPNYIEKMVNWVEKKLGTAE